MNSQTSKAVSSNDSTDRRAWFALGLWLRAGLLGVAAFVTGFALLYCGTTPLMLAFGSLIGGGALAALAWRNARAALACMDDSGTNPDSTTEPSTASVPAHRALRRHTVTFG